MYSYTVTNDGAVLVWKFELNETIKKSKNRGNDDDNEEEEEEDSDLEKNDENLKNEIYLLSKGRWMTKERHVVGVDKARVYIYI